MLVYAVFAGFVFSEKRGILPGVLNPENMAVSGHELFILEGATVHVYSLKDLKLIRDIGREGQGPGELEVTPWLSNTLTVSDATVAVDSATKLVIFTKEGKLLDEKRRSQQFTQMVPFGDYLIVRKRVEDPIEHMQYSTINRLDPKTGEINELFRQEFGAQFQAVDMIPDAIHFQIYREKIFIEESPRGFFIEVFDTKGKSLYSISHKFKKIPVTKKDRQEIEERQKLDPFIQSQPGGWEAIKLRSKLHYPSSYPAIQDFSIADDTIYVQTFKRQNSRDEYVVLRLDGKELGRVFLPEVRRPTFTEQMMGTCVRLFAIHQGHFYYLVEKDEWCELFVEKIVFDPALPLKPDGLLE